MGDKKVVAYLIGFLVVGLLVGGLVMDLWWRQRSADLAREMADLQARLGAAESKIKGLTAELNAERERRQRLEEVLSKGRK